jgi:hypothetical protein
VFHDGIIWAKGHSFGHWLGIVCPDCGCRIPSLLNVTSWLILFLLSPIRWLLWRRFGERYQAYEQQRALRALQRAAARRVAAGMTSLRECQESLKSARPHFRRRAVMALSRLGRPGRTVPVLAEALQDDDRHVREWAALASPPSSRKDAENANHARTQASGGKRQIGWRRGRVRGWGSGVRGEQGRGQARKPWRGAGVWQ